MNDITAATTGPRPSSISRRRRIGMGLGAVALGSASVALSLATLAVPAGASPRLAATSSTKIVVNVKTVSKYGAVLFDQAGLALYYDTANKPPSHWACTGGCLSFWPALVLPKGQAAAVAGKGVSGLGTVKSPSGPGGKMEVQVTWKGKALYTYAADSKGTVNGQGIQGIWFAARPTATLTAAQTPPTTAASSGGW